MNLLFKDTEKKVIIELFFATKILDLDAIIRRIRIEKPPITIKLFSSTPYIHVVKKKGQEEISLFFSIIGNVDADAFPRILRS